MMLRALGSGGCCDCAKQLTACMCEPGSGLCALQCSQRTGFGELVGWSEFANPSVPPKKYLTKTLEGGGTWQAWSGSVYNDCEHHNQAGVTSWQFSGASTFDPATKSLITHGSLAVTADGRWFAPGTGTYTADSVATGISEAAPIDTPTTRTVGHLGGCQYRGDYGSSIPWFSTLIGGGEMTETLSDEDTEAAALARSGSSGDWSAPGSCAGVGAYITERLAGQFTFAFRHLRVRALLAEPPPIIGRFYAIKIGFARRALGSDGPFLDAGSTELMCEVDTSPDVSDWVDVPNDVGYETIPTYCSAALL